MMILIYHLLDEALNLVLDDDRPLKIINAFENRSAAIMRFKILKIDFFMLLNILIKIFQNI